MRIFSGVSYSKLLLGSIVSWILGILVCFAFIGLAYGQTPQGADVRWLIGSSFLASVLLLPTVYLPTMLLTRKLLRGCRPVFVFPVVGALLFFLPTLFIVWMLSTSASDVVRGFTTTEALPLDALFVALGVTFGLSFVWAAAK